MRIVRRVTVTLVVAALLAVAGVAMGYALDVNGMREATQRAAGIEPAGSSGAEPTRTPRRPATATPTPTPDPAPEPGPEPTSEPTPSPTPTPQPEPEPQGGPALLSPEDRGPQVRALQARLRQIQWFNTDVTGYFGDVTTEAVSGFQAKREIPVTGYVDRETMDRLVAMTTEPTADELANRLDTAPGANVPGALDARCQTGRVLCIDKSSRTLRWVVGGTVRTTVDVRFGAEQTPTREGVFSVNSKSRDHVSSLYGSAMPFAMFFSQGQAVHYSSDFAAVGYNGASHGCVNVRDYDAVAALFDQVQVGDKVVVYRS
ncbi:L,D-transpeptidase family protein [Nocardioides sp.]|uniref:L,D-transpeptidase family protein n=1 Tax=Nocardioides sp. TaxID=35761 RepID=UPI00321A3146